MIGWLDFSVWELCHCTCMAVGICFPQFLNNKQRKTLSGAVELYFSVE